LLRGLILNGAFLYLFPLFAGGNGVWWAIFFAEFGTTVICVVYLLRLYERYKQYANEEG